MSTIQLGAWQPTYFNQNGELANVKVLEAWLRLMGIKARFTEVNSPYQTEQLDFLLVGDAGRAAISHFSTDLSRLGEQLKQSDKGPVALFLGKSFEATALQVFGIELSPTPRVSEFREFESNLGSVRGYLNSKLEAVPLTNRGRLFGSSLHGPILASSPLLRQRVLSLLAMNEMAMLSLGPAFAASERELGWL
ncbi:MAG: hypothetical protein RL198_434 [Actinomycetota bacterium]